MAKRQYGRNRGAGMATASARSRKGKGPAGWLYLIAGIIIVYVAFVVDPAFISALIFFAIGIGLLAVGFGMMGVRAGFPCGWFCNEDCDCRN